MKLWVIANGVEFNSEDSAYLIGRLSARFEETIVSHVSLDADAAPDPPPGVDAIFHRHFGLDPAFFADLERKADAAGAHLCCRAGPYRRACDKRCLPVDFPDLVPPTAVARSLDDVADALARWGGDVVLKDPLGYRGRQVERIRSARDYPLAEGLFEGSADHELIAQPFFAGFAEGDLRIVTAKDEREADRAVAAFRRIPAPGEWKCGLSSGAEARIVEPTAAERAMAETVAAKAGLDYLGVDLGWHDGRLWLIEVNPTTGGFIDFDIGHRAHSADALARYVAFKAGEARARR